MSQRAHVTSTDAIEAFRARLIVYLTKVRPLVEDACDDVFRTREWLEHDRRLHWENQVRRRTRELESARQALHTVRLANLRETSAAEQAAVQRARRALSEAEEKLRLVKRWTMDFDHRVGPLVKQLEQLRTMLSNDAPKAAAYLAEVLQRLADYSGVAAPASGPVAPPGETIETETAPPGPEAASEGSED